MARIMPEVCTTSRCLRGFAAVRAERLCLSGTWVLFRGYASEAQPHKQYELGR